MMEPINFQWQNNILCKSIYPMREEKLRDFLVYYQEVDLWAEYNDKSDIDDEIKEFTEAQRLSVIASYKMYASMRRYFMQPDVRGHYLKFKPLDEDELTAINNLHNTFISYWPKDIRGERNFVEMRIQEWMNHRKQIQDWIKSRVRRLSAMIPEHPKYKPETEELEQKENVALPMAENELDKLYAFLATYDKIEKRKLDWYFLQKKGQTPPDVTEAEFLVQYAPEKPPTIQDVLRWKAHVYEESLQKKNQFELLDEIRQRFEKEPKRYPLWLQYMVVHFSGMRYASAHGSWADPKDLLIRMRIPEIEEEVKELDDEAVATIGQEKISLYESQLADDGPKPRLTGAQGKEWRNMIGWSLANLKSNSPGTRRRGLTDIRKFEVAYAISSLSTQAALGELVEKRDRFPDWAWKEIVRLTPLRATEVAAPDWEKLTSEEEQESYAHENYPMRQIIDDWKNQSITGWREEHGRTHELIVTRAVCNETAEHIQHLRGYLLPGGLTARPKWYLANEKENKIPGNPRPYFVKAKTAEEYTPGASVLWLRFVNKQPNAWQVAKPVETKDKVGLLPDELTGRKKADANKDSGWTYKMGEVITRERITVSGDKKEKQRKREMQFLRWIHEATVIEVAETAEGMVVLTFETALPDDYKGTSSIGIFKKPLYYFLSDGDEDYYNRSFVGYVPEGELPMADIKKMLDWNKILRK